MRSCTRTWTLSGFKDIFWLEWAHRAWGRLIGLVFAGPLIWLAITGAIPRRLVPRLAGLFVLGGLQGAVGWFMVASGFFPDSTGVSPYRLVVHLCLALTAVRRGVLDRSVANAPGGHLDPGRRHASGTCCRARPPSWWRSRSLRAASPPVCTLAWPTTPTR